MQNTYAGAQHGFTYTYDNNGNILTVGDGAHMTAMVRWFCGFRRKKATTNVVAFSGAADQIRTGDLILTKDALYRLSYSSKLAP